MMQHEACEIDHSTTTHLHYHLRCATQLHVHMSSATAFRCEAHTIQLMHSLSALLLELVPDRAYTCAVLLIHVSFDQITSVVGLQDGC